ncbi:MULTISPECIES: serpin family protein [unclassified Aureispira]|uniref:serpin family protein n=1 Tax=unclassified Aureispira TaxID=2649989 RepID=UPI000698C946|nr:MULTISPECIES: serpin family protein [unclassified Aureispira]WMX14761.1 serpin family protein [Aureispira sp. CCB-E]
MNRFKISFYASALLLGVVSCNKSTVEPINNPPPNPPSITQSQIVDGNSQFAINIYQELVDENQNQMLSPYSISTALGMVYAGADGNTATELKNVMGYGTNNNNFHQTFNQLTNTIEQNVSSPTNSEVNVVNKIWRNTSMSFLPDFESLMNNVYLAPVVATDFTQSTAAKQQINNWVSQETNQLIPELLPNGFITDRTASVLVNAVYFKADWNHQFTPGMTQTQSFKTSSGTVNTDMMSELIPTNELKFTEDTDAEVLELFFKDKQSSMVVVLPKDQNIGINNFVKQKLSKTKINQWFDDLAYPTPNNSNYSVHIPKWDFSSDFDLVSTLEDLGINEAFSPAAANLSKMADAPLFIDKIKHKTVIATDEGGVEAAGSTAVGIGVTSVPPVARTINANRPFVFIIKDTETNSILFIGHVQDPS